MEFREYETRNINWFERLNDGEVIRSTLLPTLGEAYSEIFEKEIDYPISNSLEVGVGLGFPSRSILETGKGKDLFSNTIFSDKEEGLVKKAKEKISDFLISPELIVADGAFLPFKEKTMDLVYACSVLDVVPSSKISSILKEFYRVLKENRKILIIDEAFPLLDILADTDEIEMVFNETLKKYNLIGPNFFEKIENFFRKGSFYNKENLLKIRFQECEDILLNVLDKEEKNVYLALKKSLEKQNASWSIVYNYFLFFEKNLEHIVDNRYKELIEDFILKIKQVFNRIKYLLYHSYLVKCLENVGFTEIEIKRIHKRKEFNNLKELKKFGNSLYGDFLYIDGSYLKYLYIPPHNYLVSHEISFPYLVARK